MTRTVTVTVRGGVVLDVENLPPGWDYEVADFDNCSSCGGLDPGCECQEEIG